MKLRRFRRIKAGRFRSQTRSFGKYPQNCARFGPFLANGGRDPSDVPTSLGSSNTTEALINAKALCGGGVRGGCMVGVRLANVCESRKRLITITHGAKLDVPRRVP